MPEFVFFFLVYFLFEKNYLLVVVMFCVCLGFMYMVRGHIGSTKTALGSKNAQTSELNSIVIQDLNTNDILPFTNF